MWLFVGDDWAEDHHDVEVMDGAGRVLSRKRLHEGVEGIAQLQGLVGAHLGEDADTTPRSERIMGSYSASCVTDASYSSRYR